MADDSGTRRGLVTVVLGAAALLVLQLTVPGSLRLATLHDALTTPGGAGIDPLLVVIGSVRLVALGLGWYLVVVVTLALLVRRIGGVHAGRVLNRLVLPPLRNLVVGLTGIVLLSSSGPATASGGLVSDLKLPPGIEAPWAPLDRPASAADDGAPDGADAAGPDVAGQALRLRPLPHDGTLQLPERAAPTPPDGSSTHASPPGDTTAVHIVAPGESFWSIAVDHLAAHGRPTDDRSVATYWCDLMAANADRLVVPGDPDLLFPGQTLVLHPLPGPTADPDGSREER